MAKALELSNLSLKLGGRLVLSNVSMDLEKGHTAAVCGNAGSGRDYLLNVILKMYEKSYSLSGEVLVDGIRISLLSENDIRYVRMVDIGVLPNVLKAPVHFTVMEYITAPFSEGVKKSKSEIIKDAKGIMNLMGIRNPERIMRKRMTYLSGKELRAVIYAAALSTDPSLVVSTGPDKGLSPEEANDLFELVIRICKIKHSGFLLITPDINLAMKHCQKTIVLNEGRVVEIFRGQNFSSEYANHLYSAANGLLCEKGKFLSETALKIDGLKLKRKRKLSFTLNQGEILGIRASGSDAFSAFAAKRILSLARGRGYCITNNNPHLLLPGKNRIHELLSQQFSEQGVDFKTRRNALIDRLFEYCKLSHGILDLYPHDIDPYTAMKLFAAFSAASKRTLVICGFHDFMSPAEQYEMAEIISTLCKNEGISAILVSEMERPLRMICHRVIEDGSYF